jgi:hypothetical protein
MSDLTIEVKSTNLNNKRDYQGAQWGEQQCALLGVGDYPLPFKLNRKLGEEIQPGQYELCPSSFGTDERGNLRLSKVRFGKKLK